MDNLELKQDKKLKKLYKKNKKIIENTFVKDIPSLKKIFIEAYTHKKNLEYLEEIDFNAVLAMIEKYQNEKLSLFLKNMLKEYDSTCYLFYLVYIKIFNLLKLTDFHGKPFIGYIINKDANKEEK